MDGWIDGWIDGWMDGWIDGWIHGYYYRGYVTPMMTDRRPPSPAESVTENATPASVFSAIPDDAVTVKNSAEHVTIGSCYVTLIKVSLSNGDRYKLCVYHQLTRAGISVIHPVSFTPHREHQPQLNYTNELWVCKGKTKYPSA